jgi:hypothetical protein
MMRAVQYSTYGGDGPSSLQADIYLITLLTLIIHETSKLCNSKYMQDPNLQDLFVDIGFRHIQAELVWVYDLSVTYMVIMAFHAVGGCTSAKAEEGRGSGEG